MFGSNFNLVDIIFGLVALILAIDIHEFSHAWMAEHLGDPTPRLQGRLTLNPLAHLDPLGTLLLLLVRFGWGKPVQFDPYNLRNPRRDGALISIAGPISNMLLATICAIIVRFPIPDILAAFLAELAIMNVVLGIFNLVPIHPLDGFKIVEGFLPEDQAVEWHQLERYGIIFLLILLLPIFNGSALISTIISPPINFVLKYLLPGVQL